MLRDFISKIQIIATYYFIPVRESIYIFRFVQHMFNGFHIWTMTTLTIKYYSLSQFKSFRYRHNNIVLLFRQLGEGAGRGFTV